MMTDDEIRKKLIHRKRLKARARRVLFMALLLIVVFFMLPSKVITSFDRGVIQPCGNPDAGAPEIKAEAAAIYSLDLGRHVYEKNPDEKIDPYSITKILTCYLAIENLDPDQTVTINKTNEDLNYVDGSHILLLKDEELNVNDLLHGTMLSSANDAAYALAEAVSGSEKDFAELMNKQAAEWGCTNTHFVNPNGWKNKNHYTTAHDMAIITAKCFENEKLRSISMEKEYRIPATNVSDERILENVFLKATNKIDNIECGKTGSWEDDDCSIVLEYTEDHLNAAMVILRDTIKKRPADIRALMEFSHEVTPGFTVASEGDEVCDVRVRGGAETRTMLTMDKTVNVYPRSNKARDIKVKIDADKLEAPVEKGAKAGTYSIEVDGEVIETGELHASKDIEKGWLLSRMYISNRSTMIGGGIMLCLILVFSLLNITAKKKSSVR